MDTDMQYVPVLRARKGEWMALRHLSTTVRERITPLIEFVPDAWPVDSEFVTDAARQKMVKLAKNIRTDWHFGLFFLDMTYVSDPAMYPTKAHPIVDLGNELDKLKIPFVPVFRITSSKRYLNGVRLAGTRSGNGYCLRVTDRDLLASTFTDKLTAAEAIVRSDRSQIDLVIDFEIVDTTAIERMTAAYRALPSKEEWRSITFAGGCFPKDLTEFAKNDQHIHPRLDWIAWRELIETVGGNRMPAFGDYTVQYAGQKDPIKNGDRSASIRYASSDYWVIMRGSSVKTNGPEQYYGNAQLLSERPEFGPQDFCEGDRYIASKARMEDGTGNGTTWVTVAVNRHISFTVHQLATLFGDAIESEPGPVLSVK